MYKTFKTFFSTNVIKISLGVVFVVFILSLHHRYMQQDEPWFGEQAYWLVKEGNVKLKSMPGIFDWEQNMLIYHKLFVWTGAMLIFLFGWSVYIFKAFILVLFTLGAYLLYRFVKTNYREHEGLKWLVLLLLLTTPELIHRSFMFRPEVMIMTLGFLSFHFVNRSVREGDFLKAMIAGLFAGMAFLTHLNAVVFPVTGFLFLAYFRRWKALSLFSLVAGSTCLIYSVGLWDPGALETYRYQMQNWPTHQSTFGEKIQGGIFGIIANNLLKVLNEHQRYFWDLDVSGISALFLVALISRFKYLWAQHRHLMVYTLLLMLSIALLTSSHGPRYLVYLMPYMIVLSALVINSVKEDTHAIIKALLIFCFTAEIVFAGLAFTKVFSSKRDHARVHAELLAEVDQNSRILGPWEMIYNEIDHHAIFSYKTYEYIEDQEKRKLSQLELLEMASATFDIDYIIVDEKRKISKDFPWFKNWDIEENPYYGKLKAFDGYLILKRKD